MPIDPATTVVDRLAQGPLRLGRLKNEAALHAAIVVEAARLLGAQRVLRVLQSDAAAPRIAASKLPSGESAEALLRAVAPWVTDARSTGACRLRHGPGGVDPQRQRSCLVAVLLAPQGLPGCLYVGCLYVDIEGAHGRFEEAERGLLAMLAAQAAVALAHRGSATELQAQVAQRASELSVINSIQQGIAAKLDFLAIVDLVGDQLREVFASDILTIVWRDEAAGAVRFLYAYNKGQRIHHGPVPDYPDGRLHQALLRRKPVVLNSRAAMAAMDLRAIDGDDDNLLSVVFAPMFAGERLLGRIVVENVEREGAFDEAAVRLLGTVAASMGVAMENARLFNETREALQRQTATAEVLLDTSTRVSAALKPGAMPAAARRVPVIPVRAVNTIGRGFEVSGRLKAQLAPTGQPMPESACRHRRPGIDDLHTRALEVAHVPRGQRKPTGGGNGGNGRIRKTDGVAGRLGTGLHASEGMRGLHVESEHPALEKRQHLFSQGLRQLVAPPPCWQCRHAGQQLGQCDARQAQRSRRLGVQPRQHGSVRCGLQRLGHDVRVHDDHLKLAGTTGLRSRSIFSVTPPTPRPLAASAEPRPLPGRTAVSRMWRISASVLRPCIAARCFSARCVASGRFLTVTEDMASNSQDWHETISLVTFDIALVHAERATARCLRKDMRRHGAGTANDVIKTRYERALFGALNQTRQCHAS